MDRRHFLHLLQGGAALAALGPDGRALALADFLPVTSTVHYAFVLTAGPGPGPARMRWRA